MKQHYFNHALTFREDICIGCSHCMSACPTEAIRVKNGKAKLIDERCVDCGECYRVCPVGAITVDQNSLEEISNYEYPIALVPSVFSGQFPDNITHAEIIQSFYDLGFSEVYEVEHSVDFVVEEYEKYLQKEHARPFISTFCPSVVRLIQVKFPTLIPNLLLHKAPLDYTALYARKKLLDQGVEPDKIGVFYVTPCAAKIVAIKSPVGEEKSAIDGALNMNYMFNKSFRIIKNGISSKNKPTKKPLSKQSICWSLTTGESSIFSNIRSLAIDEISNVLEFLEKVENDELDGIDFLELRACDESCAGGILCQGNRFLTAEKLRKRATYCETVEHKNKPKTEKEFFEMIDYLRENSEVQPILARPIMKLDDNVVEAMSKMKRMYEITNVLPQVDCGICGTPSCQSFAEDIVQGRADIKQCVFVQRILEQNEKLLAVDSANIMKDIWGHKKLNKNSLRDELKDIM